MSKILKVTLEFEDTIQTLEGKEAQKWLDAADAATSMEFIHGRPFPAFDWKYEKKVGEL